MATIIITLLAVSFIGALIYGAYEITKSSGSTLS